MQPLPDRRAARSIPLYLVLFGLTITGGIATRRYPAALPAFIATYGGDALWAATVFWLLALVLRRTATLRLAAIAFIIAVAVECSQLYHAPWLDAVRESRLGGLVLGRGFLWSDLACYAAGVILAALLDLLLVRRPR